MRVCVLLCSVLLLVGFSSGANYTQWLSRSIYQIVTDRFAMASATSTPACNVTEEVYCGGTWKGITRMVDYITGMGFNAIWISPVFANTANGYHGYWTKVCIRQHIGNL